MRTLAALTAACLLAVSLAGCGSDDSSSEAPQTNVEARSQMSSGKLQTLDEPQPVPDLTVETLDGQSLKLGKQSGEVMLINFWATWCGPCRVEIPDLVDLQEKYGERGLTVVGIATDREGASVVRPFVEEQGVNYPIVIDSTQSLQGELGPVYGLPTTLVVNPDGMVVQRVVGIFPTDEFRPTLEEMLGKT